MCVYNLLSPFNVHMFRDDCLELVNLSGNSTLEKIYSFSQQSLINYNYLFKIEPYELSAPPPGGCVGGGGGLGGCGGGCVCVCLCVWGGVA